MKKQHLIDPNKTIGSLEALRLPQKPQCSGQTDFGVMRDVHTTPFVLSLSKHEWANGHRITQLLICLAIVFALTVPPAWAKGTTGQTFSLQAIIDLALKNNPQIQNSQGILAEKEGEQVSASAYPNPSLRVQAGHGKVRDPNGPSRTEQYYTLSQPLLWPGTYQAGEDAAQANVQSAQAGIEETKLNLKAQVEKTFYDLLLTQTRVDLAVRTFDTVKSLARAVQRRVEAGEAPPFEAVKVTVELLQAQKETAKTQGMVRAVKASLDTLSGSVLGTDFAIQGDFKTTAVSLDESALIQDAFRHHPIILRFQNRVESASALHRKEEQARIPDVTISGSYQRVAGAEEILGGLTIPLPLWNFRQGEIAKAKGVQYQAEARLQQAQNGLRKGITEQVQISKTASAQIQTFEQGLLKQAKEAVRIARTSFKFGEASLLEVLDAQRVLWQTFQGYAQARFELSVALAELERLVGKEL